MSKPDSHKELCLPSFFGLLERLVYYYIELCHVAQLGTNIGGGDNYL